MEQFSLEKYLENPTRKVVTRDGRPVRIICTDSPNAVVPIVGFVEGEIRVRTWDVNGVSNDPNCVYDLFFADEEEELTEFENKLSELVDDVRDGYYIDSELGSWKKKVLDIARKEIEKEITKEVEQKAINHTYAYQIGYENGKYDALKSLPKWKKITKREQNYLVYGYLSHNGYYLKLQELIKKLPKEE